MELKIGANIEKARNRMGWSQTQLGAAIRVHQGRVSQFEREVAVPTVPQILAISDATGASLDEILRGGPAQPLAPALTPDEQFILGIVRRMPIEEATRRLMALELKTEPSKGDRAATGPGSLAQAKAEPDYVPDEEERQVRKKG